jgi:hypothetical protein
MAGCRNDMAENNEVALRFRLRIDGGWQECHLRYSEID